MKTRVRIEQDTDPVNPRKEWDNATVMVCWHSRYDLGDLDRRDRPERDGFLNRLALDHSPGYAADSERLDTVADHFAGRGAWDRKIAEMALKRLKAALADLVILPLYLYDHSGITISNSSFSCPWDSGQVGWAYMTLDKARENWGLTAGDTWETSIAWDKETITLREAAKRLIQSETKVYDQYLTGDVHGFIVESSEDGEDWDHEESCWGFYGEDAARMEGEAVRTAVQERLDREGKEAQADRAAVRAIAADLALGFPPSLFPEPCFVS